MILKICDCPSERALILVGLLKPCKIVSDVIQGYYLVLCSILCSNLLHHNLLLPSLVFEYLCTPLIFNLLLWQSDLNMPFCIQLKMKVNIVGFFIIYGQLY